MAKDKITGEDANLFRKAMEGVKPLKHDKVDLVKPKTLRKKNPAAKFNEPEDYVQFSDPITHEVGADDRLSFARPGVQPVRLRELRQGKIPFTANLDLHGMTVVMARSAVSQFIDRCVADGCRCALLVHGKGRAGVQAPPILKNHVNSWLQQHPDVLAFCSAVPRDGGAGAVYILLKKR